MFKKPVKMNRIIWQNYLSECGIEINEIETSLKLKSTDFVARYERVLKINLSPVFHNLLNNKRAKISILASSLPHEAIVRMAYYLYGPRDNPIYMKLSNRFKRAKFNSGWEPCFLAYCFKRIYVKSEQMDWDFFILSMYVFAINSDFFISAISGAEERKEILERVKTRPVKRRRKKIKNVIDEESFLKDFGDIIYLSSNYKKIKENPDLSFKESGKKVRLIRNKLSARQTRFHEKLASTTMKLTLPYEFLSISEHSSF